MAKRAKSLSPFWAEKLYPSAAVQAHPLAIGDDSFPTELRPRGHKPEEIRDWIAAICRRLEVKPTTLAKQAGLAPSTVNRFLNNTGPNRNVSAETIEALVSAASKIYAEALEHGIPIAPEVQSGSLRRVPESLSVMSVQVVGKVQAGVFQEALEWDQSDRYRIQLPVKGAYQETPLVGLEVRGPSMDQLYPEGTILVCVPFYTLDRQPISGERVIVHRHGPGGVEATVKEFVIDPNGNAWLSPRSNHPDFQKPIYLGKAVAEHIDDELLISMLVVGSYRPESSLYPPTVEEQERLDKISEKLQTFGSRRG